ncbi:MAG: ATP-dependent DNA helicase RecG [Nannocystaceae bacterium]
MEALIGRLHEPLRLAAIDGFAGVMDAGLGAALRGAADALLSAPGIVAPWDEQLRHFRGGLDRFEERGQHDRSRVVAHGLRIAAGLRACAPAPTTRRAPVRDLGPARGPTPGEVRRGGVTRRAPIVEREPVAAARASTSTSAVATSSSASVTSTVAAGGETPSKSAASEGAASSGSIPSVTAAASGAAPERASASASPASSDAPKSRARAKRSTKTSTPSIENAADTTSTASASASASATSSASTSSATSAPAPSNAVATGDEATPAKPKRGRPKGQGRAKSARADAPEAEARPTSRRRPAPVDAPAERSASPPADRSASPPADRSASHPATPSATPSAGRPADSATPDLDPSALLQRLPGVGARTAERLQARGVMTIEDLAFLLPKSYEDRRTRRRLGEVLDGEHAVIEATIASFRQGYFNGRYMATLEVEDREAEAPQRLKARWFHRVGGLPQRIAVGEKVCLIGQVKRFRGEASMVHPELRPLTDPGPPIAVRYPEVEGVGQGSLARYCQAALAFLRRPESGFIDALPLELAARHGLPGQLDALQGLHAPPEDATIAEIRALQSGTSPAHRRLAFDEFFFLQLALLRRRSEWRRSPAAMGLLAENQTHRERLRASVPFEPTGAQWRAIAEIEADMAGPQPMLRLLQGDVGAGKTLVAFAACLGIIDAGGQAAIMAPTEILAEQHLRTLTPWCQAAGIKIALLTGAMAKAPRSTLLALLAAGEIDLIIGTHALLVDDVAFRQLGLVVVDEQHRFGVEQRAVLRDKGASPHLLVMTATPIPRSLALTAYGELDVSILDEMPPGRIPPETSLVPGKTGLGKARASLAAMVRRGIQAYVVCPLVEASEAIDVTHVEATAAAIRELLPDHRVEVIHGRMATRDKDETMGRFREGTIRVLVATTVIEVGVDVRDARAILIEHAERFGLAQLHQLRGRVGRGSEPSWCLLHTAGGRDSESGQRLQVMVDTTDGFKIAEKDLELRGPGELFGVRQSGVPRLRYYGFAGEGMRLLVAARDAAQRLLDVDPDGSRHPEVMRELRRRLSDQAIFSGDAG